MRKPLLKYGRTGGEGEEWRPHRNRQQRQQPKHRIVSRRRRPPFGDAERQGQQRANQHDQV
ncbi:MAG: hypothetical protein ABSF46_23410 [Terriglobia bacterium]